MSIRPTEVVTVSALSFRYYDNWREVVLQCPACRWSGTFHQGHVGYYRDLMDSSCPQCPSSPILAIVSYPTDEEVRANWDKLSEDEREDFRRREAWLARFEAASLKSASQLPELDGAELCLVWDFADQKGTEGAVTIIRYGSLVIWKEPARWEGFDRFVEVLRILKNKYGARLVDLEPSGASELYLYGDSSVGFDLVREAREELKRRCSTLRYERKNSCHAA